MEWLDSGEKKSCDGVQNIAHQLQTLLQIPAIEKRGVAVPSPQSTSPFVTSQPLEPVVKVVARYCSELESDIPHQDGKENHFGTNIRRGSSRTDRSGSSTQIFAPIQAKPPVLNRNLGENLKFVKKEITDKILAEYLESINFDWSSHFLDDSKEKTGRVGHRVKVFPSFLETMLRPTQAATKYNNCPIQILEHEDLIARNTIKLDGITNLAIYNSVMDESMKILLKSQFVEVLPRPSKHPKAKFGCKVCSDHMDSLIEAIKHVGCLKHAELQTKLSLFYTMESVPMASDQHCEAIGDSITSLCSKCGLKDDDNKQRERIVYFLADIFQRNGLECDVALFGSSASGLGFSFSDVNINISFRSHDELETSSLPLRAVVPPNSTDQFLNNIAKIVDILTSVPQFSKVNPKYVINKSRISFTVTGFGPEVNCLIQFNNKPVLLHAALFHEYLKINSMIQPVLMAFSYCTRIKQSRDQECGFLPPHAYPIMGIQYLQDCRIVPVLHEIPKVDSTRPFATASEAFKAGFPNHSERRYTNVELGRLWLSLLYYYAVKFDWDYRGVTISQSKALETGMRNSKLHIEDPIIPSCYFQTSNTKISEYILNCIRRTFLYFAIPRTENGLIYDGIFDDRFLVGTTRVFFRNIYSPQPLLGTTTSGKIRIINSKKPMENSNEAIKPTARLKMVVGENHSWGDNLILYSSVHVAHSCLRKEDFVYNFDEMNLGVIDFPPVVCRACGSESHTRSDCPQETLPPLTDVERPNDRSLLLLRKVIMSSYEKLALNETSYQIRLRIKNEVYSLLVCEFPDVQLTTFGSTENGFGQKTSDLDFCMTLKSNCFPTRGDALHVDSNDILSKVVNCLNRSANFVDVLCITSAKVPIVKYHHEPSGVDGDLCFYNLLALRNTLLLKAYNQLDPRLKILGCLLKKLGKICEISDASKGSLSSYAYMLMLINYLQNIEKPVLPVLQEIPPLGHLPNEPLPTYVVDNYDSYFFTDLAKLQQVWKGYGQNTDSVENLWLGFLCYYTEVFDFDKYVVTISRHSPLTRREKAWYTDSIAIEDPFCKQHNLGNGLSRRMSVYIIKSLRKFRQIFHSNVPVDDVANARVYYFSKKTLRVGVSIPIDRQCHKCHRIGHIARNCTSEYLRERDTESEEGEDDEEDISTTDSPSNSPTTTTDLTHDFIHPSPLTVKPFFQYSSEHPNCILEDFRFFRNSEPRDMVDRQLLNMIETSHGVTFSAYVKHKALAIKSMCEDFPTNAVTPPLMHLVPPTNPMNDLQLHLPMGYALQGLRYFDGQQTNLIVETSSTPPPPGFAPILAAPKFAMVPTVCMTNGIDNVNISQQNQQLYRFAGFNSYMNPQLPMYPQVGALNFGAIPPPPSWRSPHIPAAIVHHHERAAEHNDTNRR